MVDISEYVERLERLKAKKQTTLTPDELKEIVRELGWTEAELGEVEAQAQAHLERGNNFFRREIWEEAVKEYREAHALTPINVAVAGQLAIACLHVWRRSRSSADHHQAEYYARHVLELDSSYQPAYEVLKELSAQRTTQPSSKRTLIVLALSLVAVLALLFLGVFAYVFKKPSSPMIVEREYYIEKAAPTTSSVDGIFPVDFQTIQNLELRLEPRSTEQSNYDTSSFFKYGWLLENKSDKEIRVLKGSIDLLDKDGRVLKTVQARILDSHQGKIRPGDSIGFSGTVPSDPNVVKARLRLESAETLPAASRYDEGEKVEVIWDVKKPSNVEIVVREREQSTDDAGEDKFAFFRGTWEVTNSGQQTLEMLRIKVSLLGSDGSEVDSSNPYAVSTSDPYLSAGESRVVATTQSIKKKVTGYRIHITEFR